MVSIGNCATSFFAGFVIFGIIGFIAHEMGVGVSDVATDGELSPSSATPSLPTLAPLLPPY